MQPAVPGPRARGNRVAGAAFGKGDGTAAEVGRCRCAPDVAEDALERLALRGIETENKLERFENLFERLALKSIETEDKLNALIDLMNRHVSEDHGEKR